MKLLKIATIVFAALFITPAWADTLVLVQGYLGSAGSWRATGIAATLQANGWADAGHLTATPAGIVKLPVVANAKNRFYTIDLPTEAPIPAQVSFLAAYLAAIRAEHGKDRLVLVGHSAGGVVARATMVTNPQLKVDELITIASPHHGTGAAEDGLSLANSPLSLIAPFVGAGTINRSRALYFDLIRERPGTYLGWLNTRKHPDATYVSVIRSDRPGLVGDNWVPGWSQDMRTVLALRGKKTATYIAPGPHSLIPADGLTILSLVRS